MSLCIVYSADIDLVKSSMFHIVDIQGDDKAEGDNAAMTVGERIKLLRSRKGWGSGKLSEASGVSRAYLWQLETGGKDRPTLDTLEKLARALDVRVSELAEDDPSPEPSQALPRGLAEFVRKRGKFYGVQSGDVDVLRRIHYRGNQPHAAEDWELLYLFLKKWSG